MGLVCRQAEKPKRRKWAREGHLLQPGQSGTGGTVGWPPAPTTPQIFQKASRLEPKTIFNEVELRWPPMDVATKGVRPQRTSVTIVACSMTSVTPLSGLWHAPFEGTPNMEPATSQGPERPLLSQTSTRPPLFFFCCRHRRRSGLHQPVAKPHSPNAMAPCITEGSKRDSTGLVWAAFQSPWLPVEDAGTPFGWSASFWAIGQP